MSGVVLERINRRNVGRLAASDVTITQQNPHAHKPAEFKTRGLFTRRPEELDGKEQTEIISIIIQSDDDLNITLNDNVLIDGRNYLVKGFTEDEFGRKREGVMRIDLEDPTQGWAVVSP